jgi:hypothetical protein
MEKMEFRKISMDPGTEVISEFGPFYMPRLAAESLTTVYPAQTPGVPSDCPQVNVC